ncbi:hypothetical protein XI08_11620 [Bradyrhizobium sp. CCBAU 11361]|nr:hypothetical protein [Bradyrhizobium sp. CCBAU 11361]
MIHTFRRDASIVHQNRYLTPARADPINKSLRLVLSRYIDPLGIESIFGTLEKIKRSLYMFSLCRDKRD